MSDALVKALLRLAVSGPADNSAGESAVETLKAATPKAWRDAAEVLRLHRIAPLAWHGVRNHHLADCAPHDVAEYLRGERRTTLLRNMAFFEGLGSVLDALADYGVAPTVWKGIVLAACYYPDPSLRPMDDIDLAVLPDQAGSVQRIFESLGYRRVSTTPDAVYYQNDAGIAFDVHHRVRLFEGRNEDGITTTARSSHLAARSFRILSHEAMIAHLICHARGHRPGTGYLLRWIVDLHFVLLQAPSEFDPHKLRGLLPSPADARVCLRLMRFLDEYLGAPIPETLRPRLPAAPRLSLEEVLRSRRLALWGLPGIRGFGRLLRGRNRTQSGEMRPWPRASDILFWPVDTFRESTVKLPRTWPVSTP